MIKEDDDIVRALGFVTLHASYLEAKIDELVKFVAPIKQYSKGWQVSDKISHIRKAIRKLENSEFDDLLTDLSTCLKVFEDRNLLLHGRIYSGIEKPDILRSCREGVPDKVVDAKQLYKLANEMMVFQKVIRRPMMFDLGRAISKYQESELAI